MKPFHPEYVLEVLPKLLPFVSVTLIILFLSTLFGTINGVLLTRGMMAKNKVINSISHSIIFSLRCTPPIVMIFIIYYGVPKLLDLTVGIDINTWNKAVFLVIALMLIFSANAAEVFRAAYEAVPVGQKEAAVSSGLTDFQAFRRIILPQAAVIALPNYINTILILLKDGSLGYTIGVVDILGSGQTIISRNFGNYTLEIYLAAAIIYWCIAFLLESLSGFIERILSKGRKRFGKELA